MNFQAKRIDQFKQAAETLYIFNACKRYSDGVVSKVALQKLMYLSVILSPIKEIIINFLKFRYDVRGPFNWELQNTVDHLLGLGYVKIVNYNYKNEKQIHVTYQITEKGSKTVTNLVQLEQESEKHWWISCVCRLSFSYSAQPFDSEWKGLDKIVDLVYQDPTFLRGKENGNFRTGLDIGGEGDVTKDLIGFTKAYLQNSEIKVDEMNERRLTEIILVAFFENMYSKVIQKAYIR